MLGKLLNKQRRRRKGEEAGRREKGEEEVEEEAEKKNMKQSEGRQKAGRIWDIRVKIKEREEGERIY
jgi:hypothetical protein